ncbi:rhomboid family intramembrane serine protease [Sphingomonas sp.]|jgi:membrane associated rhomboid family serine protease|uniref:rhomboid family intramembrane serine protease n=1 Tax=Sphingomonas sp. TaxID=28214 RepID=UPI002ED9500B
MTRNDAPITIGLAIATAVFSAIVLMAGDLSAIAYGAGFVPVRLAGAVLPDGLPLVVPTWLTPLTATLIHGGIAHLVFNLVMLVYCGRMLEHVLSGGGIAILYGVGAYAAAGAQWAFDPVSVAPMIGASGAISATVGAYALLFSEQRVKAIGPVPAGVVHVLWLAAGWISIQLLIGAAGMGGVTVAIGAHVGGFLAGLALARPLLLWRYRDA